MRKSYRRFFLGAFAVACVAAAPGCGDQGNPKIVDAPAVQAPAPKPIPPEVKKGGGASSSGNMNRNPGASN